MNSNDPHSGTIQSKTGRAQSLLYQFMGRRAIVKPDAGATEKAGRRARRRKALKTSSG